MPTAVDDDAGKTGQVFRAEREKSKICVQQGKRIAMNEWMANCGHDGETATRAITTTIRCRAPKAKRSKMAKKNLPQQTKDKQNNVTRLNGVADTAADSQPIPNSKPTPT